MVWEPLILYVLLFFPFSGVPREGDPWVFGELILFIARILPGTFLIWRLTEDAALRIRPGGADLKELLFAFPLLYLTGFLVSLASPGPEAPPAMPPGPGQWPALIVLCMGTGYLEESYFRLYLLSRFTAGGLDPRRSVLFSAVFFTLCHGYEGPWGMLNAAAAGIILSLIFLRYRSLHGIAWAHGLYNTAVYLTAALLNRRPA
jgi:membrane protease YdiL (CAAX protease family)